MKTEEKDLISKSDGLILSLYVLLFIFGILMFLNLTLTILPNPNLSSFYKEVWIFITILFDSFVILQPLITTYKITVSPDYIDYKWTFLPMTRRFEKNKIKGYISIEIPSRSNTYTTYYPVMNDRLLPSISSFSLSNADRVIRGTELKNLGTIPFSWPFYGTHIFLHQPLPKDFLSEL